MRIIQRKATEAIWIGPGDVPPETPVGEIFGDGLVEVVISSIRDQFATLLVDTPPGLRIRDGFAPATWPERTVSQPTRLLARKLLVLCFLRKLTREQLSNVSGVSLESLAALEIQGRPLSENDIKALAKALNVSVPDLFQPLGATEEERILVAFLEQNMGGWES